MDALKEIIKHVEKLKETDNPLWGSMNARQMVEHLIEAVQLSNGNLKVDNIIFDERKLPTLKRFLMSDRPLPRNFNNPIVKIIPGKYKYPDFNSSTAELLNEVKAFEKYFNENPGAVLLNPSFGPLNREEWIQFHRKHFTHHYTQFNLILER